MFFKRKKQNDKKEKVIVSFSRKLGIVAIRSLEEYIKKNKTIRCFIITESCPHQNVSDYVGKIKSLEIIVSSDYKREIEKIRNSYKDNQVKIIDLEDIGERNMMRDAD